MKAHPPKTHSSPSSSHHSKPFFNKSCERSFFSDVRKTEQPFFSPSFIQPKLTIGRPGDKYEQEADAMADKIMSRELNVSNDSTKHAPTVQTKCAACAKEERLQTKLNFQKHRGLNQESLQTKRPPGAGSVASANLATTLSRNEGKGSSLPNATNSFMSSAFGADFSHVKIHTSTEAVQMNKELGARAFTHGRDIYFNKNEYQPNSSEGKQLLAHELTHVVQQQQNPRPTIQRAHSCNNDLSVGNANVVGCTPTTTPNPGAVETAFFNINSDVVIENAGIRNLVAQWHASGGTDRLAVNGFASCDGPQSSNWALSCRRALTMANWLISQGVDPNLIDVWANGETDQFASNLGGNRLATIGFSSSSGPTPTPTPAPAPAPPPAYVCGPDVTAEIIAAVDKTKTTFGGWSNSDKDDACQALISLRTGGIAWDIVDLHNNAWIHLGYRPTCASAGASPPCGSTVQVGTDCNYAGSPNYVIYGVMMKLCNNHYTSIGSSSDAADFTRSEMMDWINIYKGTGVLGWSTPSGNFVPSKNWAGAGFDGWPAVPSPSGDRSGCDPSCPTAYSGSAFSVNWVPHGVF